MPTELKCPQCQKAYLGTTTELPEMIEKIRTKKTHIRSEHDERIITELKANANLLRKYGKPATYVLAGRRIRASDAKLVLKRYHNVSDRLFEGIMQAERKVLRRRFL
jgi:flagella basal body P-ring formation protein FlgA